MSAKPLSLRRVDGFLLIIVATAIAGIAGYLVTWLVYRQVGPAAYALFAVFWAALYLVIGGLSGIQQEITRATRPIEPGTRVTANKARNFAVVTAVLVALLVVLSSGLWASSVFQPIGWPLVLPLAIGAASYVFVATLCGSLYGISHWRSLALMISSDGILRLGILVVALLITDDIVLLAWIVALPFPLTIMLVWPIIRKSFVGRTDLDVGYRSLTWNVARTVLASVSTAILVSGFPLLLGLAAHGVDAAFVGELIFTITLTRAPLVVVFMALQSYFLVRFRDRPDTWWKTFMGLLGIILGGAMIFSVLGWWLGPAVFSLISNAPSTVEGSYIAMLVGSSGVVAALCISASAVLARSQHVIYSLGWVFAAVVTIIMMFLPLEFLTRVSLALILGPIAGLATHMVWLVLGGGVGKPGGPK